MDIERLIRFADQLLTAIGLMVAIGGVLLAWAIGDLPKLNIALLAVALIAPRFYGGS